MLAGVIRTSSREEAGEMAGAEFHPAGEFHHTMDRQRDWLATQRCTSCRAERPAGARFTLAAELHLAAGALEEHDELGSGAHRHITAEVLLRRGRGQDPVLQ